MRIVQPTDKARLNIKAAAALCISRKRKIGRKSEKLHSLESESLSPSKKVKVLRNGEIVEVNDYGCW